MQVLCSQKQFEEIHKTVDKTRSNSKYVKVDKQALVNLLIDHSELWSEVKQYG